LIKSFGKSEHGCCVEEDFFLRGRGAGCLQMGRVGIRKKKKK